jgi:hypothetical protein
MNTRDITPTMPSREPEVIRSIVQLCSVITEVGEKLDMLQKRLDPVLACPSETGKAPACEDDPADRTIWDRIDNNRATLDGIVFQLDQILERLEL